MLLKIIVELSPFVLIIALVIWTNKRHHRTMELGLGVHMRTIKKQLVYAMLAFFITISFVVIPLLLGVEQSHVLGTKIRSPLLLLYYIGKNMIVVGLGEELVWRGYFHQRWMEITRSEMKSIVVGALLFGLWHYPIGQNLLQVAITTVFGLVYGMARTWGDCSALSTGIAHGLHDSVILMLGYWLM